VNGGVFKAGPRSRKKNHVFFGVVCGGNPRGPKAPAIFSVLWVAATFFFGVSNQEERKKTKSRLTNGERTVGGGGGGGGTTAVKDKKGFCA